MTTERNEQAILVDWWSNKYEKPIYLIRSLTSKYLTCRHDQRCYRIETFFSDRKSRGFHIHKSHWSDPARVSRLLVAACLAYIGMILQGLQVMAENKAGCMDRTDRNDKGLFRLGLDWIRYCLKRDLEFQLMFWFQFEQNVVNVR